MLPAAHPEYVDYEAELAVVIGRPGQPRRARPTRSPTSPGAMPFNDVSARDLQLQNPLWTSGKAIDTFAPCGPALVTLDEIGDLRALGLRTRINGELVQEGTTARPDLRRRRDASRGCRARSRCVPGDIIATGTPAGVGASKGRFLRDGDTVEVEVDGLGAVAANPVVAVQQPRDGDAAMRAAGDRCSPAPPSCWKRKPGQEDVDRRPAGPRRGGSAGRCARPRARPLSRRGGRRRGPDRYDAQAEEHGLGAGRSGEREE